MLSSESLVALSAVVGVITNDPDGRSIEQLSLNPFPTNFPLFYFLRRFVTFLLDEKSNQKNQKPPNSLTAQTGRGLTEVHREKLFVSW